MSDAPQGSVEWAKERLGRATASRIADVVAKTRNGWGASRDNYMAELITERITRVPYPSYQTQAMKWGSEQEPRARAAYAFMTGDKVEQVGFVPHPTIKMSGASPDGLINKYGILETKCPDTKAHIETCLGASIDGRYITQMQWQLACMPERKWVDFVSFDPRTPERMQCKIIRVPRNTTMIAGLERDVSDFLEELATKMKRLEKLYGKFGA